MKAVITHWDSVMSTGTKKQQLELLCMLFVRYDSVILSFMWAFQPCLGSKTSRTLWTPLPHSRRRPGAGRNWLLLPVLGRTSSTCAGSRLPLIFPPISLTISSQFCDMLEVKDGVAAGPEGYGLEYALAQWGAWQLQTNLESRAIVICYTCNDLLWV